MKEREARRRRASARRDGRRSRRDELRNQRSLSAIIGLVGDDRLVASTTAASKRVARRRLRRESANVVPRRARARSRATSAPAARRDRRRSGWCGARGSRDRAGRARRRRSVSQPQRRAARTARARSGRSTSRRRLRYAPQSRWRGRRAHVLDGATEPEMHLAQVRVHRAEIARCVGVDLDRVVARRANSQGWYRAGWRRARRRRRAPAACPRIAGSFQASTARRRRLRATGGRRRRRHAAFPLQGRETASRRQRAGCRGGWTRILSRRGPRHARLASRGCVRANTGPSGRLSARNLCSSAALIACNGKLQRVVPSRLLGVCVVAIRL